MSYIDYTFKEVDGEDALVCTRPVSGTTSEIVFHCLRVYLLNASVSGV